MIKKPSRELWSMLSIALAAGFVLCGYEFLRSPSNVLYKATYGAQKLPLIMAIIPLSVILILYLYGRLLSRWGSRRTLFITTLGSGIAIALCYAAIRAGSSVATIFLYLFREAYIVLLIEQYWSFINSTLGETSARKLNGAIIGIGSLGAILGGFLVHQLAESFGTANMLLFSAASLFPAAFLSDLAYAWCREPQPSKQEQGGRRGHLGLSVFKTSPLLVLLLLLIVATQIVSTTLGLSFQTILQNAIPDMDKQTAYQGQFYAMVNAAAAFLQFIAAPFLLSFVPSPFIHFGIPLIHLTAISALIVSPSLQTCVTAYFLFKAFDYSLFRAVKEILYIPLSFDARYRAKEIIDCFGYRFSKGGSSLLIVIIQRFGIILNSLYSWIAFSAVLLWMMLIVPLVRTSTSKELSKESPDFQMAEN